MKTFEYNGKKPLLGEANFIAPGAMIIGEVQTGNHVNIWFNSVVRADVNFIKIGENTNVQDLCMLHVTEKDSLTIGKNVTLGHGVILHGCEIGDSCLIGMGSIILDGAKIGANSLVAAGSLVPPGKSFPANSLIRGRPAVAERPLNEKEIYGYGNHYKSYVGYKDEFLKNPDFSN